MFYKMKNIQMFQGKENRPHNRVARPTSKHWQGEALTPL